MKKITSFLVLLLCTVFLAACQKGKNDPKFTLLSRKSRMVNSWSLTKGSASITYLQKGGSGYNDHFSFNGSSLNLNRTEVSGPPTVYVGVYLLNIEFKKDGSFTLSENLGGSRLQASGTWNFTSGVGKAKNKEGIVMIIKSLSGGATDEHIFNKFGMELTYTITELRKQKLALESSVGLYQNVNGDQTSYMSEFEFSGKD